MTYLETPAESPIYAQATAERGYLANYVKVFALAPEAYAGWLALSAGVRAGMDQRRYELVTLAATRVLGSAYCGLAHATVLQGFYDDTALTAIATDHHDAGLAPVDVAIMDFAGRVAGDPKAADPAPLRAHGLDDREIFQIVLAACIRRFFSSAVDAVGAEPDEIYAGLDPALYAAVTRQGVESASVGESRDARTAG